MDKVADLMRDVVTEAAETQKDYITNDAGTGRMWSGDWGSMPNGTPGRTGSIPGRVATGEMRDSVDGRVTEATQTRVAGEAGWIEDSPTWAKFQELGFRHWITGASIEGMLSLDRARDKGEEVLIDGLAKIAREM